MARALEDGEWVVRAAAATNLEKLKSEALQPHLAKLGKLLNDTSSEVNQRCLHAETTRKTFE